MLCVRLSAVLLCKEEADPSKPALERELDFFFDDED